MLVLYFSLQRSNCVKVVMDIFQFLQSTINTALCIMLKGRSLPQEAYN